MADLLREGADRFILPRFQNLSSQDIATKSSKTDFVTIADQETEAWLIPSAIRSTAGFSYWRGSRRNVAAYPQSNSRLGIAGR